MSLACAAKVWPHQYLILPLPTSPLHPSPVPHPSPTQADLDGVNFSEWLGTLTRDSGINSLFSMEDLGLDLFDATPFASPGPVDKAGKRELAKPMFNPILQMPEGPACKAPVAPVAAAPVAPPAAPVAPEDDFSSCATCYIPGACRVPPEGRGWGCA